jgi:hypothetical protein
VHLKVAPFDPVLAVDASVAAALRRDNAATRRPGLRLTAVVGSCWWVVGLAAGREEP